MVENVLEAAHRHENNYISEYFVSEYQIHISYVLHMYDEDTDLERIAFEKQEQD